MATVTRIRRLVGIQRVLSKYGLDDLIASSRALRPLRFLFRFGASRSMREQPLAVRLRLALEELGP
ncbi:MAG: ubiquinone biosynthesis regulatory protein kinase UbiB, partial [Pseudomonadota bacterium]